MEVRTTAVDELLVVLDELLVVDGLFMLNVLPEKIIRETCQSACKAIKLHDHTSLSKSVTFHL